MAKLTHPDMQSGGGNPNPSSVQFILVLSAYQVSNIWSDYGFLFFLQNFKLRGKVCGTVNKKLTFFQMLIVWKWMGKGDDF